MSASSSSPSMIDPSLAFTFHLFPRLPPELRIKIWEFTVDCTIGNFGPCLYASPTRYFRKSAAEVFDTAGKQIVSALPRAAQVSREARASILHYITKEGLVGRSQDRRKHLFVRMLDPDQDVLYFSRFRDVEQVSDVYYPGDEWSARVALPEKVLRDYSSHMPAMFRYRTREICVLDSSVTLDLKGCWEICPDLGNKWGWSDKEKIFKHISGTAGDGSGKKNEDMQRSVQFMTKDFVKYNSLTAELRELVFLKTPPAPPEPEKDEFLPEYVVDTDSDNSDNVEGSEDPDSPDHWDDSNDPDHLDDPDHWDDSDEADDSEDPDHLDDSDDAGDSDESDDAWDYVDPDDPDDSDD